MVCGSTQHGLYEVMQHFHPDMPCVCRGLSCHCRAHGTDHDRFVFYMHVLGFRIAFPPVPLEHGMSHTMCSAVRAWQTAAIHEWMDAGHLQFAGCACGRLAPGCVAVVSGVFLHGTGVHPVAARFADYPFGTLSCSFCYKRFMVSGTPLWRHVCSSLSGNPYLGSVSCSHPVPARSVSRA